MSHPAAIILVHADDGVRAGLAAGLREDGMDVVEFAAAEQALAALGRGMSAAVLVTEPALGRLTNQELAEQARDAVSQISIILTPEARTNPLSAPSGAHCLAKPLEAAALSQFIRLVTAETELRGALLRSRFTVQAERPSGPDPIV